MDAEKGLREKGYFILPLPEADIIMSVFFMGDIVSSGWKKKIADALRAKEKCDNFRSCRKIIEGGGLKGFYSCCRCDRESSGINSKLSGEFNKRVVELGILRGEKVYDKSLFLLKVNDPDNYPIILSEGGDPEILFSNDFWKNRDVQLSDVAVTRATSSEEDDSVEIEISLDGVALKDDESPVFLDKSADTETEVDDSTIIEVNNEDQKNSDLNPKKNLKASGLEGFFKKKGEDNNFDPPAASMKFKATGRKQLKYFAEIDDKEILLAGGERTKLPLARKEFLEMSKTAKSSGAKKGVFFSKSWKGKRKIYSESWDISGDDQGKTSVVVGDEKAPFVDSDSKGLVLEQREDLEIFPETDLSFITPDSDESHKEVETPEASQMSNSSEIHDENESGIDENIGYIPIINLDFSEKGADVLTAILKQAQSILFSNGNGDARKLYFLKDSKRGIIAGGFLVTKEVLIVQRAMRDLNQVFSSNMKMAQADLSDSEIA